MADMSYTRPEYQKASSDWKRAEDVLSGERAVKEAGTLYLPPVSTLKAEHTEGLERYANYKMRATFMPIASRTLASLIGAAFRRDPTLKAPSGLDYIKKDIDGYGNSIYQQAQTVMRNLLATGRCGVLVDYPKTEGGVSQAERQQVRAQALFYKAVDILDWRTRRVGAQHVLSYVKLREYETVESDDGFSEEQKTRFRILDLPADTGRYRVRVFDESGAQVGDDAEPTGNAGTTFNYIPFQFFGAHTNDVNVDPAPMGDLVGLNIAHYQVYADWRKVLFLAANPQPVVTGLSEEWRDHLEDEGIVIGSEDCLLLPAGGDFKWAQINADQPLRQELDAIMQQCVAVGARLIERGSAAMTATQSDRESAAEHSVLSLCAANTSEGYEFVLRAMAEYEGASGDGSLEVSREYQESEIDPTMLAALVQLWQSGTIPKKDAWEFLRKCGLLAVDRTDAKLKRETEEQAEGLALDDADPLPGQGQPGSNRTPPATPSEE
ncbi:MAG: 62kDa structural protein [Caudoviricetes sp.]|nr:MAG: 62kDa structural protein [Caudoviricetes sp.]